VIGQVRDHILEHGRGRLLWSKRGILAERAARLRHRPGKPLGAEPLRAGEHRLPPRPEGGPVVPHGNSREILLPCDQRASVAEGHRPVRQGFADDDPLPPGRSIDARAQDRDGLLGRQHHGRHLPAGKPDRAWIRLLLGQERTRW
jgi:hypothetical protein